MKNICLVASNSGVQMERRDGNEGSGLLCYLFPLER